MDTFLNSVVRAEKGYFRMAFFFLTIAGMAVTTQPGLHFAGATNREAAMSETIPAFPESPTMTKMRTEDATANIT